MAARCAARSGCLIREASLATGGASCDGDVDCADSDCATNPVCASGCTPTAPTELGMCTNGTDDDCDGAIDCVDRQCARDPAC